MRVAWVHPSWRDLVIDRLSADGPGRRRFLSRCGVHGVTLALSTAGGATGARRLPLLLDDADWDVLTDRLYILVAELEPAELIAVLSALSAALDDPQDDRSAVEVAALARTALDRAARRWDAARAPIPLDALASWYHLARRVEPSPTAPSPATTWAELLPVRGPRPDDRAEVERFSDWLALCRLLSERHLEVWETLSFGPEQVGFVVAFLDELDRRDNPAADVHLSEALESICALLPRLAARAMRVTRWIERGEESAAWAADPGSSAPVASGADLFDVRRVLADL